MRWLIVKVAHWEGGLLVRWLISEAAHVIVMWWLILTDLVEKWRLSGGSVAKLRFFLFLSFVY